MEKEKIQLNNFKNQINEEIDRVLKHQSSYCYLTMEDINQFRIMMNSRHDEEEQDLLLVNAPCDSNIEIVHQSTPPSSSTSSLYHPYHNSKQTKKKKSSEKVIIHTPNSGTIVSLTQSSISRYLVIIAVLQLQNAIFAQRSNHCALCLSGIKAKKRNDFPFPGENEQLSEPYAVLTT